METTIPQPPTPSRVRIAIDAMGGDHAPRNEVEAALQAVRSADVTVTLVGRTQEIMEHVPNGRLPDTITIVHADDVVSMSDEPSTIVKSRKESSLYKAVDLMRNGNVDAVVSAGNTGAVMATATMMCGRLPGVSRPTIGSFFPTQRERPTLVVDVGANVDSKPRFLHDYAVMGSVYYAHIVGTPMPTVGLLSVGEEREKGNAVTKETYTLLERAPIRFVGNVEGRDILKGTVDVVVCDGFEGNIVLKFAESVIGFLKHRFVSYARTGVLPAVSMALMRPILRKVLSGMDYQDYGGVPLLGVNGVVIIGHGSSSSKALLNMLRRAEEVVRADVNTHIQAALQAELQSGVPPETTTENITA